MVVVDPPSTGSTCKNLPNAATYNRAPIAINDVEPTDFVNFCAG